MVADDPPPKSNDTETPCMWPARPSSERCLDYHHSHTASSLTAQELVREVAREYPLVYGKLYEEPFVDFRCVLRG
jgi:hypothetical protein